MDLYQATLNKARSAHNKRTGHRNIMTGLNFIECFNCNKHAHLYHITDEKQTLIHHDDKHWTEILPEEF